jgi:hypothetical protein
VTGLDRKRLQRLSVSDIDGFDHTQSLGIGPTLNSMIADVANVERAARVVKSQGDRAMARRTIIATSMLALATMCSPAFAYSNVSPKPALQKVTSVQRSMTGHGRRCGSLLLRTYGRYRRASFVVMHNKVSQSPPLC